MKPNSEVLMRSIKHIERWARLALDHRRPFGSNYRRALVYIHCEARDAIEKEVEVK